MGKINELINKPKINVIGILIGTLISWIIGIKTEMPASANIGALIPIVYAPFVGILSVAAYFISRIITKKYNWIISLFATIHLLKFAIEFYITEGI